MRHGTEDPAAKAADDALIAHMFGDGEEGPRNDNGPRMGNAEAEDLHKGALAEQPKVKSYTNPPGEASAFQARRACAAEPAPATADRKGSVTGKYDRPQFPAFRRADADALALLPSPAETARRAVRTRPQYRPRISDVAWREEPARHRLAGPCDG